MAWARGIIPSKVTPAGISYTLKPDDIYAIKTYIDQQFERSAPFDIVVEGETPGRDHAQAQAVVQPFVEAGATWWLEDVAITPYKVGGVDGVRVRIQQGLPRVS